MTEWRLSVVCITLQETNPLQLCKHGGVFLTIELMTFLCKFSVTPVIVTLNCRRKKKTKPSTWQPPFYCTKSGITWFAMFLFKAILIIKHWRKRTLMGSILQLSHCAQMFQHVCRGVWDWHSTLHIKTSQSVGSAQNVAILNMGVVCFSPRKLVDPCRRTAKTSFPYSFQFFFWFRISTTKVDKNTLTVNIARVLVKSTCTSPM